MIYSKSCFKSFLNFGCVFSTKKPSVFPYIMGGLPFSQYFVNNKAQQFQHMLLTEEIDETFIGLYKKYLDALQARDLKYLNQNVDKKLLEGLTQHFPSVVVRNKDAPIVIAVHSNELIGNLGLNRQFHGSEMRLKKTPQRYEDCFSAYEGYSLDENMDKKMHRLFSTKVYFKSARKLTKVKKGEQNELEKQSPSQEIHMVQFEAESQSSKFKIMLRKAISKLVNLRNKQKHRVAMMRLLWGASPNSFWKIVDVDRILHGNLPKIVTEFSEPNLKQKESKNIKK